MNCNFLYNYRPEEGTWVT